MIIEKKLIKLLFLKCLVLKWGLLDSTIRGSNWVDLKLKERKMCMLLGINSTDCWKKSLILERGRHIPECTSLLDSHPHALLWQERPPIRGWIGDPMVFPFCFYIVVISYLGITYTHTHTPQNLLFEVTSQKWHH